MYIVTAVDQSEDHSICLGGQTVWHSHVEALAEAMRLVKQYAQEYDEPLVSEEAIRAELSRPGGSYVGESPYPWAVFICQPNGVK